MKTSTLVRGDALRVARRAVAECCADANAGPLCLDSASLMTSEVVTNALLHGQGPVTFGVDCETARVRVEVGDSSAARPVSQRTDLAAEGGRGMLIVDALASEWGIETTSTGKIVWFEVDTQP